MKTSTKLDARKLLGYRLLAVCEDRKGTPELSGASTSAKLGAKPGAKVGAKVGSKIGTKFGIKTRL
jgi:hypothetical protein